jgi:hypothetical protein
MAVVDDEAMAVAQTLQVIVAAVVVVVMVVAVVEVASILSTEPVSPKEYATFIGPTGPAIVASTVHSSTKQSPRPSQRFLRPPHNPQILRPTFSRQKGWPSTMAPSWTHITTFAQPKRITISDPTSSTTLNFGMLSILRVSRAFLPV